MKDFFRQFHLQRDVEALSNSSIKQRFSIKYLQKSLTKWFEFFHVVRFADTKNLPPDKATFLIFTFLPTKINHIKSPALVPSDWNNLHFRFFNFWKIIEFFGALFVWLDSRTSFHFNNVRNDFLCSRLHIMRFIVLCLEKRMIKWSQRWLWKKMKPVLDCR